MCVLSPFAICGSVTGNFRLDCAEFFMPFQSTCAVRRNLTVVDVNTFDILHISGCFRNFVGMSLVVLSSIFFCQQKILMFFFSSFSSRGFLCFGFLWVFWVFFGFFCFVFNFYFLFTIFGFPSKYFFAFVKKKNRTLFFLPQNFQLKNHGTFRM